MSERKVPSRVAANIDPARLGERDDPQNDWGDPGEGAVHGANHTRRAKDADGRFQGAKTRTATKNQISRRG